MAIGRMACRSRQITLEVRPTYLDRVSATFSVNNHHHRELNIGLVLCDESDRSVPDNARRSNATET
jgi:hypothetical protein